MDLNFQILQFNQNFLKKKVVKGSLLFFYKLLKQFVVYADRENYTQVVPKENKEVSIEKQAHLNRQYLQFFTQQRIQELLNLLITQIIPIDSLEPIDQENFDSLIDAGEEKLMNQDQEFENSFAVLSINLSENLT